MAKARAQHSGTSARPKPSRMSCDTALGHMYAVARKSKFNPEAPVGEGFILILPLNEIGLLQLALGTINGPDPDFRLLAKPHERPAGIYMWCVFAPGPLAAGMALFMEEMAAPRLCRRESLFPSQHRCGHAASTRLSGLTQGVQIGPIDAPNIWVFPRTPPRAALRLLCPGRRQAGDRHHGRAHISRT